VDGYALAGIIGGRGYINLNVQVSASRPFFGGDTRKALEQATGWWGGIPSDIFNANAPVAARDAEAGEPVRGFAGALGIVEGTVRRLERLEDSDQLQPGEILVTTMTNIGWTPLFPRLAAIVTDLGAPLSHAAIVARELGIPAVVGCADATMRLKTGDQVRLIGGQGLVEISGRS
jgi:pyruvate,water dikinase